MGMRTRVGFGCAVLLAAAIAAVITTPVAAHTRHRPRCSPRGSETITQDRSVRVYSIPEYIEGVRQKHEGIYACVLRSGKTIALKPPRRYLPLHQLDHITLAGVIVAFGDGWHGIDSGCTSIVVLDLASGRTLLRLPQVACFVDAGFVREGQLTDLVVNSHGSVAWIASKGRREARGFEVHSANTGSTALLDEGPEIVPGSLRLAGGEVTWRDGVRELAVNLR